MAAFEIWLGLLGYAVTHPVTMIVTVLLAPYAVASYSDEA
jgi:hypothetical protein